VGPHSKGTGLERDELSLNQLLVSLIPAEEDVKQ
jgi:hypothetical protein